MANEYTLNKEATSYDDCLDDALRLSLKPYEFAYNIKEFVIVLL